MPLPWDDIDAQNGLLKEAPKKDFRVYFSRIIAKLDAQSSELPSRKQLSLALDALLYDQRKPDFWPKVWKKKFPTSKLTFCNEKL